MNYYKDKRILITGGTGSLGRCLVKKLTSLGAELIIFSRDEGKQAIYFGNNDSITKIIGDIRDYDKLQNSIKLHSPDYIIHAAALKRVDDMEFHPDECVKTNICGTENVARSCIDSRVKKCILVSTDKACRPINVYGSSKFIAERIFSNFDYNSNSTIFSAVRYGNVIASRGSFLPLWRDLLLENKKIKVTSKECTRFLFTLNEAVDAVLNALENSVGGEVFVPKINSYTLPTCVKALEFLLGKKAAIEIVGLRPGEKLHEDMLAATELPFTHEVENTNLLQIRPQYTKKTHQPFPQYHGPHFNSKIWVTNNHAALAKLIEAGLKC
jgi:UDP-N-acetylglucosamine 4,6-dehydratase